jgi:indole-3-glycerol phosphate synthase
MKQRLERPTILQEIAKAKEARVSALLARISVEDLRREAVEIRKNRRARILGEALSVRTGINIIAEIKRASPSKGVINDLIDVPQVARDYVTGGAAAISVLTEEDFFRGSIADLRAVRKAVGIPILRKDFIVHAVQIYEAAIAGADAVLLIVAMLNDEDLGNLYRTATSELGLDALVEVHTAEELKRAETLRPSIIGVNNRNLDNFNVSLDVSRKLISLKSIDCLMVAESGLRNANDLVELRESGFDGFLIGETLMKSPDASVELDILRAGRASR